MRVSSLDLALEITDGCGRSSARLRFQHDLPGIGDLLKSEIETGTNIFADPAAMIFRVLEIPMMVIGRFNSTASSIMN